jgi:hypothetical protein
MRRQAFERFFYSVGHSFIPRAVADSALDPRPPAPEDERHHKEDQEYDEEDPSYLRRNRLDPKQPQSPRDEGDNEKHYSPP